MVDTALGMMASNKVATDWESALSNNPKCFDREALDADGGYTGVDCRQHEHGVSFNEISKLHAMAYSWNGDPAYLNTS